MPKRLALLGLSASVVLSIVALLNGIAFQKVAGAIGIIFVGYCWLKGKSVGAMATDVGLKIGSPRMQNASFESDQIRLPRADQNSLSVGQAVAPTSPKELWVSTVMNAEIAQSDFVFYLHDELEKDAALSAKSDALGNTILDAFANKPFSDSDYPKRLVWHSRTKQNFDRLPPVSIRSFLLLRADVATIFARHDLGETKLVPVGLYDRDNITKFEDKAFFLVPRGGQKTIDTTEPVAGLRKIRHTDPPRFWLGGVEADLSQLRVIDMPKCPPACWMDPRIPNALFLNNALVKDLQDAGHDKAFYLTNI